jgi:hypothetical protein
VDRREGDEVGVDVDVWENEKAMTDCDDGNER